MIDYEGTILDLLAKEKANRKEYEEARVRHLHAIAAETNASTNASQMLAKLQKTIELGEPSDIDAAFRIYQLAEFTKRQTRDVRIAIGDEMAALSAANVYTRALGKIKTLRETAFALKELGIEPVSMMVGYGTFTDSDPYGLKK